MSVQARDTVAVRGTVEAVAGEMVTVRLPGLTTIILPESEVLFLSRAPAPRLSDRQLAMLKVDVAAINPPAPGSALQGTPGIVCIVRAVQSGPLPLPAQVNAKGECIGGFEPQAFLDAWEAAHPAIETCIAQDLACVPPDRVESYVAEYRANGYKVLDYGPADAYVRDTETGQTVPKGWRVELVTIDPGYARIGRLVKA